MSASPTTEDPTLTTTEDDPITVIRDSTGIHVSVGGVATMRLSDNVALGLADLLEHTVYQGDCT